MGISRVNVGKMRRKWESLKDDPHYYITNTSKLTISILSIICLSEVLKLKLKLIDLKIK
ncbi:Hypothetical protein BOM_1224 (plasmid) [Borrelia miyamotoi FR64b]|uniref:Uncharacterized protein n=2 Tax=Borrelia miyamotoi TaxID=47466 RepID=A0A481YFJ4_9SPIR|nr:hypothetical protein [Borrelia miyamotoi]AHH05767.1 Hypothetical protein BOM_1224 [Borrelia miyamotoi FR64b]QBK62489.1 hypothetical protein EZU67_04810 [Borrelia miyamotoi]QBK63768.1 hypothetical protein EZU68_05050 [Borrelia miyamotoi]QBK65025.1 hypothetical protein EZU69_04815 [Borrelia miyamotoi]QBK66326.1 hypothetical protein EZU70_05065 [Borrelia miyamotoi]